MTEMRFVKPVEGLLVPYEPPSRAILPAAGATVAWSIWWDRRLTDGDVIEIKETQEKPAKASKKGE